MLKISCRLSTAGIWVAIFVQTMNGIATISVLYGDCESQKPISLVCIILISLFNFPSSLCNIPFYALCKFFHIPTIFV